MTLRKFLAPHDDVPAAATLAWLKRRILQSPPDSGPHATYTLMLQALQHIAHERDLSSFPADKVWRLFEKAKERVGWVRKRPQAPPRDLPLHHKYCSGCAQIKPNKAFRRLATAAECAHYGWTGTRRTVIDNSCQACRIRRVGRLRKKARRRLFKDIPHAQMRHILLSKIKATQRLRRGAVGEFYLLRLACLKQALIEVERRVDGGLPLPDEALSDWTLLLPERERNGLFEAHQQVLEGRRAGRTPSM